MKSKKAKKNIQFPEKDIHLNLTRMLTTSEIEALNRAVESAREFYRKKEQEKKRQNFQKAQTKTN
ncbi:MAG TPA: hypothetical protein VIK14_17280 [Ignavibacteria bacterium]